MSAVRADHVAELLVDRFSHTPILTWRDEHGEFTGMLDDVRDAIVELGVEITVIAIDNNEFGTKNRLFTAADGEKFLLHRVGAVPADRDNWLLDVELGYGVFTADATDILVRDLGLASSEAKTVIAAHEVFFRSQDRVEQLRALLTSEDDANWIRAKMSAVVLGLRGEGSHRLHTITFTLLDDLAGESTVKYDKLVEFSLDTFFWDGCRTIYGYIAEDPTVRGLATWLFDQARNGWPTARTPARIDFEQWRKDSANRNTFTTLALRAQEALNIKTQFQNENLDLDALVGNDLFPIIDTVLLNALAGAALHGKLSPEKADEIVRRRATTTWFSDHEHSYRAVAAAAGCLARIDVFQPEILDPAAGITAYADTWSRIDRDYRTFRYHAERHESDVPATLTDLVDRRYTVDYQQPLAEAWQGQVDTLERWRIDGITPLGQFAQFDLPSKAKTLVIISDALRYEIGVELAERITAEDRFTATVEPRLATLPSFTQLGMASHLPHQRLQIRDGSTVLADGKSTQGSANRKAIFGTVNATTLDYEDARAKSKDEIRSLWSAHDAVVVYHNTIDATGDKADSERRTPEACVSALDEITSLIKRLSKNVRATRILVTADHGFLYQANELEPGFYLSESPHGNEVLAKKRRYVLGRGLVPNPAFTLWRSDQLGLDGDMEVQIPKSLHRLRIQGYGVRFVHGGATLQEVVVPLVSITHSRTSDTSKVATSINTSTPTITSSSYSLMISQTEPVTAKRRGRLLRVGIWHDEELLSNEVDVHADSPSADQRERYFPVDLALNDEAGKYEGKSLEVRVDEVVDGLVIPRYQHTTVTLQRTFGGFYDTL